MQVFNCGPHCQSISIEDISYEDAMILKALLENERVGPNRWAELIVALQLIIVANQPEETLSLTK